MKLKLIMLVSLFAFGFAMTANAGAVSDTDGDLVPDQFDNCLNEPNGPGTANRSNQGDTDLDGYGNACDADYSASATGINYDTDSADFTPFLGAFTNVTPNVETDHTGDGSTSSADFQTFLGQFQNVLPLGPSGLACAGTVTCTN